jgi:type I restriction enzyme S subunit
MRAVPVVDDLGDYFEVALNAGASRDFIESNIKTTAGQQGIAGSAVRTAPIPLPPSVEARLISESVNTAALIASELETELAKRDAEVSRLRQSILAAAFSGKLISKAKKPKKQEAA